MRQASRPFFLLFLPLHRTASSALVPPSSSSPVVSSLVPLAPARSLVSLASRPAAPPPGVAPLPSESGTGVPPRPTLSFRRARRRPRRVISHRRHAATPRVAAAASTPTRVAVVTAHHVIVAHPNLAVVSRRAAYAAPRASNLTSITIVILLLTYLLRYVAVRGPGVRLAWAGRQFFSHVGENFSHWRRGSSSNGPGVCVCAPCDPCALPGLACGGGCGCFAVTPGGNNERSHR